jgi:2TM domain
MAVQTHPKPTPVALPQRPQLRLVEARAVQLHLFTYVVGGALFWTLWAAITVTADPWYWWPILPFAGWAIVLAGHLWHVHRPSRPRRGPRSGERCEDQLRRRASPSRPEISRATRRHSPRASMSMGFSSSSAGIGLWSQTGM